MRKHNPLSLILDYLGNANESIARHQPNTNTAFSQLDDIFGKSMFDTSNCSFANHIGKLNVTDDGLTMAIPGVSKENVTVQLDEQNRELIITIQNAVSTFGWYSSTNFSQVQQLEVNDVVGDVVIKDGMLTIAITKDTTKTTETLKTLEIK